MKPAKELDDFLSAFSPEIQDIARHLRDYVTESIPEANELIWDNYNALAMAYSKSKKLKDAFCHIAVYSKHVNFGFNRGAELNSETLYLEGKGKLIRHIKVHHIESFPKEAVTKLMLEALMISEARSPNLQEKTTPGESIVMSISPNRRRPS